MKNNDIKETAAQEEIRHHAMFIYAHLYAQSFGPEQFTEGYYADYAYEAAEAFHEYTQKRNKP